MKNRCNLSKITVISAQLFFILLTIYCVSPSAYAWQIDNFGVDINIDKDGSFVVSEKIVANFSDQPKHGIYRNLPIKYRDEKGNPLNLHFQILDIYDEDENPWQYSQDISGVYLRLKIGDPYTTLFRSRKAPQVKF